MSFKPKNIDDFRLKEEYVRRFFYSKYGGFCNYFEKNFSFLLNILNFYDKGVWMTYRWEKRYCLIALVKLASTFKSSYELIISGYYPESVNLTRSIYDAFLRMLFIQKFPSRAEELTGNKFKIGNVEKELGIKEGSLYHIMSEFAHGNRIDVLSDLVYTSKGTKTGISGGPQFPDHSDWFASSINSLMYYLWAILAFLPKNQPDFVRDKGLLQKYQTLYEDLEKTYIRTYVNKAGKPSDLATKGVDEILGVINNLPEWA